jgi:hypothetical protein
LHEKISKKIAELYIWYCDAEFFLKVFF